MEKDKIKMTIHRALAELKLIDSRIEKGISQIIPTGIAHEGKLVNGIYPKEEFEKNVKAKYQSVTDLIGRKNSIKSAIVKANGITEVKIGEKTMTIADAINFKTVIAVKKNLIEQMTKQHNSVKSKLTIENEKVHEIALQNAKIMLGRQTEQNVNPTDEDVKNIMDPFIKRNELHLVDPLGVEKAIEVLQIEVDDFELEVDAALSEINATTFIEI